jgi:putative transposase
MKAVWDAWDMKQHQHHYHGPHSRYRLQFHLVWIPKYRKRVMIGEVATSVRKLFYDCAQMNDWWITRLAVMPDHVHMLIELPPTVSVSQAVKIFKGGSSRALRQMHPELDEWLWGNSFWAVGYFAESVGRVTENAIKLYIENQKDHPSMPQQGSLGL